MIVENVIPPCVSTRISRIFSTCRLDAGRHNHSYRPERRILNTNEKTELDGPVVNVLVSGVGGLMNPKNRTEAVEIIQDTRYNAHSKYIPLYFFACHNQKVQGSSKQIFHSFEEFIINFVVFLLVELLNIFNFKEK